MLLWAALACGAKASGPSAPAILLTCWSDDTVRHPGNPMPGSVTPSGATVTNPEMRHKLDAINVLAYGFLQVDASGNLYFGHPAVDLSASDVRQFCHPHPNACPHADSALAGSFSAFARLDNRHHTLRKIASIGGAGTQSSLDNALNHPEAVVQSAVSLIQAYHLDGIDLDFEPDDFFNPGQGEQYAQLVVALRQALGGQAFISIEVPGDWETLRSIDCPADMRCRNNLALIAANGYVSLMGYEYHGPYSPGTVTGNDSNLYSDPDEPLLPRFYHASDNQAVGYLTFRSVPTDRILLGFPAYFVSYGGVEAPPGSHGLYQAFERSQTAAYDLGSQGDGTYRTAQRLLQSGFAAHRQMIGGKLSAVYAYSVALKQWISYDDPDSVAAKADYVMTRHLAGLMMWEIGEDVPVDSRQSLLGSAHRALFGTDP
jgi:chitinase